MKTLVTLLLTLIVSAAVAGTTSTIVGGISVFHPEGTAPAVTYKDAPGKTAHDACQEAAKAYVGKATCSDVFTFTTVVNCTDEKAPKLYLATVKIDGSEYLELPGASFTEDTYVEMADLYVHAAAWPAGYPNCWIRGEAPRAEWRLNTKDEPGKAFMERRDPSMPPGDLIAEEPNSVEPVCWPGDDCTQVPAP